MNEDPCVVCGRWTGVYHGFDAMCKQCQDSRSWDPYVTEKLLAIEEKERKKLLNQIRKYRDGKGYDLWHEPPDQTFEYGLKDYYPREKERYEPPEVAKKRKAAERQREKERKALAEKRARFLGAEERECSECFLVVPHEPDDFLCIRCRHGEDAIPPEREYFWKTAVPLVKGEAA